MPPIPSGSIIKTENRTLTRRPLGNSRYTGSQINKSDDYDTDWINHLALGDLVQGIPPARKEDRGEYDTTVLELRLTEPYGEVDADERVATWSTDGINAELD